MIKLQPSSLSFLFKKTPTQMFFCGFWELFKNTTGDCFLFSRLLRQKISRYYTKKIKMTSIEVMLETLIPTLNIFLFIAITLEATIQKNLSESRRVSTQISLVQFLYNGTILFVIHRNRSSHPEVFCKKGALRKFAKFIGKHLCRSLYLHKTSGLQLYLGRVSGTCVLL